MSGAHGTSISRVTSTGMALVVILLCLLLVRPRTMLPRAVPGDLFSVGSLGDDALADASCPATRLAYVTKLSAVYSRRVVLTWAAVTPVLIVLGLKHLQEILRTRLSHPANARRAVIAGCTESSMVLGKTTAQLEMQSASRSSASSMTAAGERSHAADDVDVLGKLEELPEFVRAQRAEVVFVALPLRHVERVMKLLDALRDSTASIYYLPDIFVFRPHSSPKRGD